MRQGRPRNTKHMGLAQKNRNESYHDLNLSKRLNETLNKIHELESCTPQQAQERFDDQRPINEVQSRFTDLRRRGYIRETMSYHNNRTGRDNTVYRITTDAERIDYTKAAGQEWTNRIKELERDYLLDVSIDTKILINKEILKLNRNIKNLINI